jgi:hypothetical protein
MTANVPTFAGVHKAAMEGTQHRIHAWDIIVQKSRDHGCASKDCDINLGRQNDGGFPCVCLDSWSKTYPGFFRDILNYLRCDYEAIIPLAESRRLAQERFDSIMVPK